jgi:hypothetical protein
METLRIVNKALAGEPEHAVLQSLETNTIYEFSQITNENIVNADLSHHIIQSILQRGHQIEAIIENNKVTLQF